MTYRQDQVGPVTYQTSMVTMVTAQRTDMTDIHTRLVVLKTQGANQDQIIHRSLKEIL